MKQKLQTLFDKSNIKQTLLNTAFILFLLSLLYKFTKLLFETYDYESWAITEYLVNFQGGFVRRGLLGEILLFFVRNFNLNIEWTLKIVCLISLVIVCVFFVKAFLKKGYSLYILPLCFFLGTHIAGYYWMKRDHLMFLFFIATFWVLNKINKSIAKFLIVNILVVIALLIHESFAFFTLPFLFLLFFNEYKNKGILQSIALSLVFLLPSICVFLLTLHYHGDMKTAQTIWDSWVSVANLKPAELNESSHGALSAIGWTAEGTFKMHLRANFWHEDKGIVSVVFWSMIIPVVYYIVTNALLVFRKNENIFTNKDKTILSSVLIFQFVCLLPFFSILSCDLGRIIFYWVASSFVIFLLTPKDKIEKIFPPFLSKFVEQVNKGLTNILHPTKTTVILIMMFIGIPIAGFSLLDVVESSVAYHVLLILSKSLIALKKIIFIFF